MEVEIKDYEEEKLEKKLKVRRYKNQVKKTRKKLNKLANNYNSWDFLYLMDFIYIIIEDWVKYYTEDHYFIDNCIYEEYQRDIRPEIVNKLLNILKEYKESESNLNLYKFFDYIKDTIGYIWD